jgi:precorrin-6B methylase 2
MKHGFADFGHGDGSVALQVAVRLSCYATGIELSENAFALSEALVEEYGNIVPGFSKDSVKFVKGSFGEENDLACMELSKVSFVFVNNVLFGQETSRMVVRSSILVLTF